MAENRYVVHWSGKVCRVEETAELNLTGERRTYYILTPVRDRSEKIYVPADREKEMLRPVMTGEEARELIAHLRDIEPLVIHDEKQRAQEYKEAFYSRNYVDLVRIAKELYQRREKRIRAGKTLPGRDAQMMELVEKTFEEELAVALGVDQGRVKEIIAGVMGQV